MNERNERHGEEWRDLPLQAPIPIPTDVDGENAELADLADLILERLELIGSFDGAYVREWVAAQLAEEQAA